MENYGLILGTLLSFCSMIMLYLTVSIVHELVETVLDTYRICEFVPGIRTFV